eukprot:scaffold158211_cov20-Prasinocladus_malaysianus.AAC.1
MQIRSIGTCVWVVYGADDYYEYEYDYSYGYSVRVLTRVLLVPLATTRTRTCLGGQGSGVRTARCRRGEGMGRESRVWAAHCFESGNAACTRATRANCPSSRKS